MNKLKTTKKAIKEEYENILSVGYRNLQYLLQLEKPFAYSERTDGWACDYYNIDDTIISTGYSPIGKSVSYNLLNEYNNKAKEIINNQDRYNNNYSLIKEELYNLLVDFINECK